MRRTLAAALLGISLWIGSLAWSSFLMTRTVLDPDRSERVAESLLDDEDVRARMADNLADTMARAIPAGAGVDQATIQAAADDALDSPAVRAVVFDAFVRSHQAFLGEGDVDAPASISSAGFGDAARAAIVEQRPELAGVVPELPVVEVPLPTQDLPNIGPVRRFLDAAWPLLAFASAVGVATALLVAKNRPAILRRAGVWALGLSAVVLAFAYGIPALAAWFAPDQAEIVAALVGAMAATTRLPAIVVAGLGGAAILSSFIWKFGPSLIPDGAPEPTMAPAPAPPSSRRPRRSDRRSRAKPVDVQPQRPVRRRPVDGPAPSSSAPSSSAPSSSAPSSSARSAPAPASSAPSPAGPAPSGPDPTRVEAAGVNPGHVDQPHAEPAAPSRPSAREGRPGARWENNVGWVFDGDGPVPDEARWVPGVGYVLDD